MIRGLVAIGVTVVLGFGFSAGATGAAPEGTRVIDRTFGCIPQALTGDVRAFDVTAVPRGSVEAADPFAPRSPGFIGVASGGWEPRSELVAVRTRRWQRFGTTYSPAGVFASRGCRQSRLAVLLSNKGLLGPPTRWMKSATCLGRGRVIIRVRAVLATSDPWRSLVTGAFDGATGAVVQASLAVRSERTGKPLAHVELARDGTTKLWLSASCDR